MHAGRLDARRATPAAGKASATKKSAAKKATRARRSRPRQDGEARRRDTKKAHGEEGVWLREEDGSEGHRDGEEDGSKATGTAKKRLRKATGTAKKTARKATGTAKKSAKRAPAKRSARYGSDVASRMTPQEKAEFTRTHHRAVLVTRRSGDGCSHRRSSVPPTTTGRSSSASLRTAPRPRTCDAIRGRRCVCCLTSSSASGCRSTERPRSSICPTRWTGSSVCIGACKANTRTGTNSVPRWSATVAASCASRVDR